MSGTSSSKPEDCCRPSPRRSARDRIFDAARELFYRQGIRGVGVEAIAEQAGATKMSLYRAFPGKDELVAECLRHSAEQYWQRWDEITTLHAGDPRAALIALFRDLEQKQQSQDDRGCPIANAAVELTADDHPGREIVRAYCQRKRERLRELCARLGISDPGALADGLQLLLDGASLSRVSYGPGGPGVHLTQTATALIDAARSTATPATG